MENITLNLDEQVEKLKQTLLLKLRKCSKIFIIPHKIMDFDALASATAVSDLCNYLDIENFIITNDNPKNMKSTFQEIYYELNNNYKFINTSNFETLNDPDALFIFVDTCVSNLIPIENINDYTNEIIVIDHHKPDEKQIKTEYSFINLEASSASEIIFYLLKSLDIFISVETAQLLLAGIYLDTSGLYYVNHPQSFQTVTKLLEYGANLQDVQNLFTINNFEEDRKQKRIINNLIDYTKFYHDAQSRIFAITYNIDNPETLYTHEQLAEACDSLLQYPLDAALVIGCVDKKELGFKHEDKIAIKARSKISDIMVDVAQIMEAFGGGGDLNRGAALINFSDVFIVKETLKNYFKQRNGIVDKKDVQKVLTK